MYEIDFEKFKDIFFAEAKEHLVSVDASLEQYRENQQDTAALFELFRIAHTLKSMSATMGFDKLTPLVSELSRTLDKLHKGKVLSTPETVALVKESFGAVKALIDDVASGENKAKSSESLIDKLKAIAAVRQGDHDLEMVKDLFFSEVKGYLESVQVPLSELIIAPTNQDIVFEVFRIAHTIRGMSATMGFDRLTCLSTAMTELLDKARQSELTLNEHSIRLITACFEMVAALVGEAAAGADWKIDIEPNIAKIQEVMKEK